MIVVFAHGLVQRSNLPIPEWLFGWAAAIVLCVSFVALAALWPRPRLEQPAWRPLPGGLGRALGSRAVEVAGGVIRLLLKREPRKARQGTARERVCQFD